MKKLRVLLADDYEAFHASVRRLMEPDFEFIAAVSDGEALVKAAEKLRPDILLVDITMPVLGGIAAVKKLHENGPGDWVVIYLTMNRDPIVVEAALQSGALGYVLKSTAAEELIPAIREALQGRSYVSPAIGQ